MANFEEILEKLFQISKIIFLHINGCRVRIPIKTLFFLQSSRLNLSGPIYWSFNLNRLEPQKRDRPLLKPYGSTAALEDDEPDYDDFRESEFSVESQYFDSPAMHSDVRVGMRPSRDLTTCNVPWKCERSCPFGYFR